MKSTAVSRKKAHREPPVWRIWIDNENRIVSFHEVEGCALMEFRNRDLFISCVEQYTGQQYRYQ